MPTLASLDKLCTAFGITLSQLFAEDEAAVELTPSQQELLNRWSRLSEEQQNVIFDLLEQM